MVNSNSDSVSVIETANDTVVKTISVKPAPEIPTGSAPDALAVSCDGSGARHDPRLMVFGRRTVRQHIQSAIRRESQGRWREATEVWHARDRRTRFQGQ